MEMLDWFEKEHTEIVSRIESTKILSDELNKDIIGAALQFREMNYSSQSGS